MMTIIMKRRWFQQRKVIKKSPERKLAPASKIDKSLLKGRWSQQRKLIKTLLKGRWSQQRKR